MRALLLLLLAASLTACHKPATPPHNSPIRFLALGDSYTIGESVDEADGWPNQLARALRAAGQDVADPQIIATTGWTTDELSAGINRADPKGPYALVTLLIGVNNQYRGREVIEYKQQLEDLLKKAIELANGKKEHVVMISIPDYGLTPFAAKMDTEKISKEIDVFNSVAMALSIQYKVHYIDITPGSREVRNDPSLVASDGLHPSEKEYLKWAQLLSEKIISILK